MNLNFKKTFFPRDENPQHFKALDGLRGIAVMLVLCAHATDFHMLPDWLSFKYAGKFGVYLFFILSAYLLDRQIAMALNSGRANMKYWLNYLMRRFLRIYPLFIITVMFNYWLSSQGSPYAIEIPDLRLAVDHLLLLRTKYIYWSIPVEFIYYFISPLLIYFINRFLKWNMLQTTLFILILIALHSLVMTFYHPANNATSKYLPIFLIGSLISFWEVFTNVFTNLKESEKSVISVLGVISAIIIASTFDVFTKHFLDIKYPFHSADYFLMYSVLWSVILISIRNTEGIITRICRIMPLRFVGVVSFSAYLWHAPILFFVKRSELFPASTRFVCFILGTILVSSISYVLIEKPFSKIRIKY